jgi:hypothetical protein
VFDQRSAATNRPYRAQVAAEVLKIKMTPTLLKQLRIRMCTPQLQGHPDAVSM